MDEDRPYGHNTLKLPAIFIPDGNPNNISTADILRIIGPHAVMIRAIFTPKKGPTETPSAGAPRPGAGGGAVAALPPLSGGARATLAGDRFAGTGETDWPDSKAYSDPSPGLGAWATSISPPEEYLTVADPDAWSGLPPVFTLLSQRSFAPAGISKRAAPPSPTLSNGYDDPVRTAIVLRYAEHRSETDDPSVYRRLVGGDTLGSIDNYPNETVRLRVNGRPVESSAAGAYQINRAKCHETVRHLARQGVLVRDFSPGLQDLVAKQIILDGHALELIQQGNIEAAFGLLNRVWVSLPGGLQQAMGLTAVEARRRFDRYVAESMAR
jgi:muramidase (phage lysozyme)